MREVSTHYMIRHIPELSSALVNHWVQQRFIEPMTGEGYSNHRIFPQEQFVKAKYMAFLVYTLGFTPRAASDIADIILKREFVQRERIWVAYGGAMIGVPDLDN